MDSAPRLAVPPLTAGVAIVAPVALACRAALSAIEREELLSVVSSDALDLLPLAVSAALAGCTFVAATVRRCARPLVGLSDRQLDVVDHVAVGMGNHEIARSLAISLPTVKRDIAVAQLELGCANRVALIRSANALGFSARRLSA